MTRRDVFDIVLIVWLIIVAIFIIAYLLPPGQITECSICIP